MTRFARAKGSKSSNERLPDEATPWSEMKMQLESSQIAATSVTKKAKSAKELLAEKDQPFYHDTTGNVNHEWAAFDDVSASGAKRDETEKAANGKCGKKNKKERNKTVAAKLHTSNDDRALGNKAETCDVADACESKSEEREKMILNDGETGTNAEKIVECKNARKRTVNKAGIDSDVIGNNPSNSNEEKNSDSKSKKRVKKSKKLKSKTDNNLAESNEARHDSAGLDGDESKSRPVESSAKENSEKLSKRQKRNQKKQRKIMSEKNESIGEATEQDSCKVEDQKSFDVEGNDWSNEVKFGRQANRCQISTDGAKEGDDRIGGNEDNDKAKGKRNENKDSSKVQSEDNELGNGTPGPEDSNCLKESDARSKTNGKRKGGKNEKKEYKRRKPDEGVINMIINGNEVLVVKYDGFPVKKEDADRLKELKKNMIIKGIPRSEINIAMKLERRKAEKALARERKRVCFHCRKSGHNLSDCPELGRDEAGTGICFKCGSAEHTHFECKVVKTQEFRHASCFICREQGHIARQCPDNPKGLYPQGGSCKICGDVTHLKKDCPDLIKEKEETNITADKITSDRLEALQEDTVTTKTGNYDTKTKNKIIKF